MTSSANTFIISPGTLLRVQVKSTTHARYHSYVCNFHRHKNSRYTADKVGFIAAYIIPKDIWFIFPIAVIMKVHSSAVLSPHMKVSKYGQYQEAWHLLRGEDDSTVGGAFALGGVALKGRGFSPAVIQIKSPCGAPEGAPFQDK